jgi:hypothetical protein
MSKFITKLTPEKKKLRELKFNIYISTQHTDSNSTYICIIVDKSNNKTILTKEVDGSYIYSFIIGLIDGINQILDNVEEKYHKYCLINIKSDNIYILTLVNQWLPEWTKTRFENRNYQSDLIILNTLLNKIHFKTSLIYKSSDEYAWFLDKKVNDIMLKN